MVVMHVGVLIVLAGAGAPAAFAEVVSVGGLGKSVHAKLSSTVWVLVLASIPLISASTVLQDLCGLKLKGFNIY